MHPKLVELEKQFNQSTLTQIFTPLLAQKEIELWIKRDDLPIDTWDCVKPWSVPKNGTYLSFFG